MSEELAIIRNIGVGTRDTNGPCIWFDVRMLHGGALQVLQGDEMIDFIGSTYDVLKLNGKTCVVERDGGIVKFIKLYE